jgi:hypothetical protein
MLKGRDRGTDPYYEELIISTDPTAPLTASQIQAAFETLVQHGFKPSWLGGGEPVLFGDLDPYIPERGSRSDFTTADAAISRITDGETAEINFIHGGIGFRGVLYVDSEGIDFSLTGNVVPLTDDEKCQMGEIMADVSRDLTSHFERRRLFSIFHPPPDYIDRQLEGQYDIWSMIGWLTILGPEQVESLGRDRLLEAPAHRVEALDSGAVLILLETNPNAWDEHAETYRAVTEHLDRPPE